MLGIDLAKPRLRAQMELRMKEVAEGRQNKD